MVALMLLMGVASPIWMRAIDTAGAVLAQEPTTPTEPVPSAQAEPRSGPDIIHPNEAIFIIPATEAKK
jgi:hypothetical protein